MASDLPDWAAKHDGPGIKIRPKGSNYYAYQRKTIWNKEKKKSEKTKETYLGKVTPEGIQPVRQQDRPIQAILEHGNIELLHPLAQPLEAPIREHFGSDADTLLAAAALRAAHQSPLKNLRFLHDTTTTHQYWPDAGFNDEAIAATMRRTGADWGSQLEVYRHLSQDAQYAAIDLTQIFSQSQNIHWLEKGYNSHGTYHDQLQLLMLHSLGKDARPTFLKLLPGSIRDAPTLANAIWEAGLKDVILVHDKGFTSGPNLDALEKKKVQYIAAVKRDLSYLEHPAEDAYTDYFLYRDRVVWWREYGWGDRRVLHFLDKALRAEEETTFLRLVEEGKRKRSRYEEIKGRFGTLAVVTNTKLAPAEAYEWYKQRMEIERTFDAMKNMLDADRTYMRSREAIAGYFFIVFLALYLYASVLGLLREKDLVKKYSVRDVLLYLSKVYKVRVGDEERVSEVPKKVRVLMEKLGRPGG